MRWNAWQISELALLLALVRKHGSWWKKNRRKLEGVRGGLGAKKCYGTRCFFFKIDFSSKNWGKMKVGHFCFLQNNWWPKCLISFWLGTCIHHSHGIIFFFCVIKIARLLWNWSKKCLILGCCWKLLSMIGGREGQKIWLKNEWFLSRSKIVAPGWFSGGMFCYCLQAHHLFKILHFRIWAFRLLTNNNKHEFWLGCFSIILKERIQKKNQLFVLNAK